MGESVLLLVTIVLVLIAAVTLLIGIFGDSLALIFVSIGASVIAAIVLGVVSQMSKRRPQEAMAAGGPAPLAAEPTVRGADAEEPVTARIGAVGGAAAGEATSTASGVSGAATGGALAIADYDSLRVNEIMPKLEGLDLDELEAVAQHEESTKNRTSVLNKIDELMDALEAADIAGAGAVVDAGATDAAEAVGAAASSAGAGAGAGFPIPDFDELDAEEIVELLADLDGDELEAVAEYEETHANRDAVLDAIDDRLDELEGIAPARAATAATGTKKSTAKTAKKATKASAKKVTKAAPKRAAAGVAKRKAAAPAKRTATAAKSATKKAASAATAKKATAKKSTAKKATAAKKTAAKKTTRR
jgi:hypothetical protein